MSSNNIEAKEFNSFQSKRQNIKNQQLEKEDNAQLEFQRQRQNEYKNLFLNITKAWDFSTQYIQFFSTQKVSSKLKQILKESGNLAQLPCQTENFNLKEFLNNKPMIIKTIEILQSKIIENGFQLVVDQLNFQNKSQDEIDIQISLINNTVSYEITEVFCKYGRYTKIYTVLNLFQEGFRHSLPMLGIGGMGQVYLKKCFDEHTYCAVKCIKIGNQSQNQLKNAIRQFFITDLLSSLQISPKIIRNTDFDFIIFDKCIQFELEKCETFKISSIESDLKENLLFMHLLKIVHNDIKPSNIMYSPSFQKNIFIDFGIAEHLSQSFGEKTWTKFKGTYEFCSEEMQNIVCGKNLEAIDLYKNDIVMITKQFLAMKSYLKNSLKIESKKKIESQQKLFKVGQEGKSKFFYLEYKTKLYLYKNKDKIKLDSRLNQIFYQVQNSKDQDGVRDYIKQIFNFTIYFKIEFIFLLLKQKLFKTYQQTLSLLQKLASQSNYTLENKGNYSNLAYLTNMKKQRVYLLQNLKSKRKKRFKNISVQVEKTTKIEFIFLKQKIKIENIQFILFNKKEAKQLDREDYFQLFLSYSSIWSRNYKEASMRKRCKASLVFRQVVLQDLDEGQKDYQYLKEAYFPDDSYIRTEYKDLIWVYGYLLSYCFTDSVNQFKAKYILVVVKQTILLNFKYCLFLCQAFVLYIKYLIKNKVPTTFSLITIHKCQLMWLAYVHYSYIISQIQQLKVVSIQVKEKLQKSQRVMKFNLIQIRRIISNYISGDNQQQSFNKYKQISLLAICAEQKQSCYYYQFIQYESIIQQIDNEIFSLQNLKHEQIQQKYYNYVLAILRYCYTLKKCKIIQINSFKFKTKLAKIYNNLSQLEINFPQSLFQSFHQFQKFDIQSNLENSFAKFDSKINCSEISKYFFIDLRLQWSLAQKDKFQFARLISILAKRSSFLCLNYEIIDGLNWPKLQFKEIFDSSKIITQEQISKSELLVKKSSQQSIIQQISQKFEALFFNIINYYVINLDRDLRNFYKIHILQKSKRIREICKKFQYTVPQSCFSKIKSFIIQKLNALISWKLMSNKQELFHLEQTYQLLKLQLVYKQPQSKFQTQSLQSLNFAKTQKQLYQCMYQISNSFPILQQKFYERDDPSMILHNPIIIQIMEIDQYSLYLDKKIQLGWQSYKLRIALFEENAWSQSSFSFLNFYQILFCLKKYDILSQIILMNSYLLWANKLGLVQKVFNNQIKQLVMLTSEKEILFCTVLIQKIRKLANGNLNQTYLFTINIHILHYQQYLNQNKGLWKKLLFFVCKNFQRYPKLANQEKNIKIERREQILLRCLIFQQQKANYRKKMIMIRKWIKVIQDSSPFQRKQSQYYLKTYFKQYQKDLDILYYKKLSMKQHRLFLNSFFQKDASFGIFQQKQCSSSLYLTIGQIFRKFSSSKKSIYDIFLMQNKAHLQQKTLLFEYLLKLCKQYDLANFLMFCKSANHHVYLTKYYYLLHLQQKLKALEDQISQCQKNVPNLWLKNGAKWEKLKKQYCQKENQLKRYILQIKQSQYYKVYEQISKIQLKILQVERKKLIKQLVKQNKLQYNQIQGKYETISINSCFEVNFSKNDTIEW